MGLSLEKARAIHGDLYDYSLVDYNKSCTKIKIKCPKHGVFEQTPNNHLMGMRCIKCANEESGVKRRSNTQIFIDRAKKVHQDTYDYSATEYVASDKKLKIICRIHGVFEQLPGSHFRGQGCPFCQESHGERKFADFLNHHGIRYEREKTFESCRHVRKLPFDFYIPDLRMCIEFDGRQHFFVSDYFGGVEGLERLKKTDTIKNKFCADRGIKLLRLVFKDSDYKIKSILEENLLTVINS